MYVRLTVVFFWKTYTSKFGRHSYLKLLKCIKNCEEKIHAVIHQRNVFRNILHDLQIFVHLPRYNKNYWFPVRYMPTKFTLTTVHYIPPDFTAYSYVWLWVQAFSVPSLSMFDIHWLRHGGGEVVAANLKYPWFIRTLILRVWINWCNSLYVHLLSVNLI